MARPQGFNRDEVLRAAMHVFWEKGFAATTTKDLRLAMGIGHGSVFSAFGDKRNLFLKALALYERERIERLLAALDTPPAEAVNGLQAMLLASVENDGGLRKRGCMSIGAILELGNTDAEVASCLGRSEQRLHRSLIEHLQTAKSIALLRRTLDSDRAAYFLETVMRGIQVAAKVGASAEMLQAVVQSAMISITEVRTSFN